MDALQLFQKAMLTYDNKGRTNEMFYYSLPYERNYDLCNTIPIAPVSGNVIKFYQYRLKDPVIIYTDAVDTDFKKADEDDEDLTETDFSDEAQSEFTEGEPAEMTDEEMAALLTEDRGQTEVTDEYDEQTGDEFEGEYTKEHSGGFADDQYEDDSSESDDVGIYEDSEGVAEDWEAQAFDD